MPAAEYFFTVPSELGRRRSMVDPLGFRGTISHFMMRLAPGFTGRVRGRAWLPILAWAAREIEERQLHDAQYGDDWEQAKARVGKRRETLLVFERALRLGAALDPSPITDNWRWRYGNRVRWWEANRDKTTKHYELATPPFFSSRAAELGNNALGSLRRALERLGPFAPSEPRLVGGSVQISSADRYKVTSRGQALAEAYEADLRAQEVGLGLLHDWGLWPTAREVRNDDKRREALIKISRALPVTKAGAFDRKRFPNTVATLDHLLQVDRDPLFVDEQAGGPLAVVVAALMQGDPAGPRLALALLPRTDFWSRRLGAALDCADTLMGAHTPEPPMFEILAEVFVQGMRRAFPDGALDCPRFDEHAAFCPDELRRPFRQRRDEYRRRWEALVEIERDPLIELCPRVEVNAAAGIMHFNDWLETTKELDLGRILDLHADLPRFVTGRVLPLVERDASSAYLDEVFPWSSHGVALAEGRPDAEDVGVEEDDAELLAEDDEESAPVEVNRELITNYWATPYIAARVITGVES